MARLVVVSNRVAAPDEQGRVTAGGLAVAVGAAMKERDGLWFGWSGKIADDPAPPMSIEHDAVQYVVTDLKPTDFREYYNGFANRALWPLLHYRVDLAEYLQTDFQGYRRVNEFFAERLSPLLRPDDVIRLSLDAAGPRATRSRA